MELFTKLFGNLLVFVYHCFDRIVIHGYLSGLSRPAQVVYFFRDVVGVPVVDKAVLSKRTAKYRGWVETFARNRGIPMEWGGERRPQGAACFAVVAPYGAGGRVWRRRSPNLACPYSPKLTQAWSGCRLGGALAG